MNFSSTEHPLTWFRDEYRAGNLDIRPPYQRGPVWADRQRSALIESVLLALPIPEVYIQEVVDADGETTHAVVDGQQRIRTILQFIGVDEDEAESNDFSLNKLGTNSPWRDDAFADLSDDDRQRFWRYRLAVRVLETDRDEDVRDIFKRLNKFTVPLKPQELRNATYMGPFAQLATHLADQTDYWAENRIISAQAIRRLGDIEFVAELLIGSMHGPQGGSAKTIDEYYAQFEDFEDEFPEERAVRDRYETTLRIIEALFPAIRETRWRNKTDFYSLFVALAFLSRSHTAASLRRSSVRKALRSFGESVNEAQADDSLKPTDTVGSYVRALARGANDKARRGDRHRALVVEVTAALES